MSTVIRADTDQLRTVARQMRATADQITSGSNGMNQSMQALDATWGGSAHDRGMARWAEITPKYPPAVERLEHFANELEALAQRLDDAAAVFGGGAGASARSILGGIIAGQLPNPPITPVTPATPMPASWNDRYAQIGAIDAQIAKIRAGLGPEGSTAPGDIAARQELAQLTAQRAQMLKPIIDGIPNDGPSPNKNGFVGCTNYIAEKRDIEWNGNAHAWNENAQSAGYEVGSVPVKGSIIVFEPGVMGANKQYGHVAYVDSVVESGGVFKVTISEANPASGANGEWIAGTHTPPTQRSFDVRVGGDGKAYNAKTGAPVDISFIYGKKTPA
ncbi:MAG: CHAP domain-containing protein [Chloroflexales bacterium]